ncbi:MULTISPECIES: sensor histidine kinase [Ruminococcus]|uniref:ATP-binding region ATPase domain protein n=1 Tax=Ruminococcus albus (strain ATCC 27210 / DSM 20455 / JCM 14654 / NCDO 2250 / 7) TaxID=697329 RepID=E6UH41_RUMA7|nr:MULTISPECIES: sensor histidine kinase [Ruminococcus]ADU22033.1 ATP-binding region ATPase domain protein [Ruminococcus albus 7 = DSM 20455]MCR5020319.1 GHKL domain-containing protein [Ruminococcus sp.]
MTGNEIIAELLNNTAESVIIVFFLFNIFKGKYYHGSKGIALMMLISISAFSAISFLMPVPLLNLGATLLLLVMTTRIWFNVNLIERVFYSVMFIVIALVSEFIPIAVLHMLDLGTPMDQLSSGKGRYIGMIISKILMFWLSVYVIEFLKNKTRSIPLRNWFAIVLTPLFSILILYSMFDPNREGAKDSIIFIVSAVGLLTLNLFVFDFFDVYANQLKMALMEQQLKNDEENYKLIENKYNEIRTLRHDFKNQIAVANDMFEKGRTIEAIKHLNDLQDRLSESSGVCYTGISSVDSIVNLKWQEALKRGIDYVTQITVTDKIELDDLQLCRIFANLLDNAIEGCERYHGEDKFISIRISQINGNLHISISNSSNPVDVNDLRTEKSDLSSHGLGIGSIRKAVEELNGIIKFKCECEIFCVDIIIKY